MNWRIYLITIYYTSFPKLKSNQGLNDDHITIRRIMDVGLKCSQKLYETNYIPIEDIEIVAVVIREFVDHFHHKKEETACLIQGRRVKLVCRLFTKIR